MLALKYYCIQQYGIAKLDWLLMHLTLDFLRLEIQLKGLN
jgi:hypothetical protein